ncbi:MAG: rod shape-determining protein MreC [Sphingomonadales bacterium]|nr:rod shape-determining protein MreC [Sphingomonadales bacterium]MBD3773295.1 rod shape-determining protein MreC [Paracoccaceae bacterium]
MAPPASRRSGHSRRAQYGIFTGYVVAGFGALLGAGLLTISLVNPAAFGGLRGAAHDVARPVGEASAVTRSEGQGFFASIAGFIRAGSQNAQLKREMELARIRLAEADATKQENARLKALVGLDDAQRQPVAITRFIGSTSSSTRRFGYIGAGSADGVRPGMPVRSPRGVVGRVLEVGRHSARVLLLTDSESVLPVRLSRKDLVAFIEGRGSAVLKVRLINLGVNPLKRGDVFVTSGAGGYYAPGIAVAVVTKVTGDGAEARMIADPAATDFVAVEDIYQAAALRAAQLPPGEPLDDAATASPSPAAMPAPQPTGGAN